MSKSEFRGFIKSIMAAPDVHHLAETFGAVEWGKKTKRLTAKEFNDLVELGAKKEKLLTAQGKR